MMMLVCLMTAISGVSGQAPGRGVSKSTYACSEAAAEVTRDWFEKYFPVSEAFDDCPQGECDCGVQSRVELDAAIQGTRGFGLHCTYAAGADESRVATTGGVSLDEISKVFADALQDWTSPNGRGFGGYAVGFSTPDLESYRTAFDRDGVNYYQQGGAIKFLVPSTAIVIELISDPTSPGGVLTPQYVSRTVDDLDIVETYYDQAFHVQGTKYTNDDGDAVLDIVLPSPSTDPVIIRYLRVDGQTGDRTTSWFQDLLLTTARTYQTSPASCWTLFGDFHYAYDGDFSILPIVQAAEAMGFPYRSFAHEGNPMMGSGPSNAYVLDPSGWWIQLDGQSNGMPPVGGFDGNYCYTFCQDSFTTSDFDDDDDDTEGSSGALIACIIIAAILVSALALYYWTERRAQKSSARIMNEAASQYSYVELQDPEEESKTTVPGPTLQTRK